VVDDAIVVVENIERLLAEGLSRATAQAKGDDEVHRAVIAIALCCAPCSCRRRSWPAIQRTVLSPICLNYPASTLISAFNSLTLARRLGAAAAQAHKKDDHGHAHAPKPCPPIASAIIGGLLDISC